MAGCCFQSLVPAEILGEVWVMQVACLTQSHKWRSLPLCHLQGICNLSLFMLCSYCKTIVLFLQQPALSGQMGFVAPLEKVWGDSHLNSLEIPHQGPKDAEVQVFPQFNIHKALGSIFLCLLKSQKGSFEVVLVLQTCVRVYAPLIFLNFQSIKLKVNYIWQIFPGSWLFLSKE